MITQGRLKELLHYDPESGLLTSKTRRGRLAAGDVLGTINTDGYIQLGVDYKDYLAHRLAFLYMTGKWPADVVDHVNGVRNDNRWVNLRAVPVTTNVQNLRQATIVSSSGLLGAFKHRKRWRSEIRTTAGRLNLGTFNTAEEAHAAYLAAKRELHEGCTI